MSGAERRLPRIWGVALLVLCLVASVPTAAAPAVAKQGGQGKKAAPAKNVAGRLDPSFGRKGKTTVAFPAEDAGDVGVKYDLPFQFTAGELAMALAPGGKIVVAGSTKVVRFLANGKPDPAFGGGGAVAIDRPPGQTFVLADVAVDSKGRVLVAGSARPQPTSSTPDPLISSAMVRRFAADGSVDGGFAKDGTLVSNLGLEPPKILHTTYPGAAVGLRSLVVDAQDRPVLTGGSVTEVTGCYSSERAVSTAFVARLTEAGALDTNFAGTGLRQIADLGSFQQGSLLPSGSLLALGTPRFSCAGGSNRLMLTGFNPEGNLDPAFGFAGFRSIGTGSAPVVAVAPSGKIVLLGARKGGKEKTQLLTRLLPDGGVDPGFGRTGRVELLLPKGGAFTTVAVDGRERILLAGRASKPVRVSRVLRSTFLLARMNPKGSVDRGFGRRGTVRTGFGGPSSSAATQVMLAGKGRILVGGQISSSRLATGSGFALARYLTR
jgi:uncharacterized delta-60 repeat protein